MEKGRNLDMSKIIPLSYLISFMIGLTGVGPLFLDKLDPVGLQNAIDLVMDARDRAFDLLDSADKAVEKILK